MPRPRASGRQGTAAPGPGAIGHIARGLCRGAGRRGGVAVVRGRRRGAPLVPGAAHGVVPVPRPGRPAAVRGRGGGRAEEAAEAVRLGAAVRVDVDDRDPVDGGEGLANAARGHAAGGRVVRRARGGGGGGSRRRRSKHRQRRSGINGRALEDVGDSLLLQRAAPSSCPPSEYPPAPQWPVPLKRSL